MRWGHDEQLTHQVSVWINNDGDYVDQARELAYDCRTNDYYEGVVEPDLAEQYRPLGEYLSRLIRRPETRALVQMRYALSDRDLDSHIDWARVADDLLTE